MTRIIIDSDLRKKLLDLRERLYLCDEAGRIIGQVTPLQNCPPPDYTEPPLSEEEWKRRREGPDFNIDEVIAKLEAL